MKSFVKKIDILERPSASEKSLRLKESNQYVFIVGRQANKRMIQEEVERRYGVKVVSVNTVRLKEGREKKAVVTLKAGQKIEI